MKLISIGFGSTVCAERVLAVIAPESAPIKRLIQEARERGMLIDASFGRKTKSVLLMDTDHVLLSSVSPEILSARDGRKAGTGGDGRMRGKLFVVSGPSGVGKTRCSTPSLTAAKRCSILYRQPRARSDPARSTARAYYFVSRARFEELIANDALLEYAEYVGNYYGTPLQPIREAIENGVVVVMDVEVVGALKIKKRLPDDAVLVFVTAPSFDVHPQASGPPRRRCAGAHGRAARARALGMQPGGKLRLHRCQRRSDPCQRGASRHHAGGKM